MTLKDPKKRKNQERQNLKLNTAKKLVINHMRFQEVRFSEFLKVLFIPKPLIQYRA